MKRFIILSGMLCLASILFFSVAADKWDGTTVTAFDTSSGRGSSVENPILIESAAQLAYLSQQVNAGSDYSGIFLKLTVDIDLDNQEWTPIGWHQTNSTNKHFKGNFDGNQHAVLNVKVSTAKSGTTSGLFGAINGGYVKNLGVTGNITWGGSAGGVVGSNFSGVVSQCYNKAYVKGTGYVGGVVGYSVKASGSTVFPVVENCYNRGNIEINNGTTTTSKSIGGVVGYATALINNSYNTGTITILGTDFSAKGGITGTVGSGGSVTNSYYLQSSISNGIVQGTEKSETEMSSAGFISLLNASQTPSVWEQDTDAINAGFPVFAWQNSHLVTSVEPDKDNLIYATASNSKIKVRSLKSSINVYLYDMSGKLLSVKKSDEQGNASFYCQNGGVYLIRTQNKVLKVII